MNSPLDPFVYMQCVQAIQLALLHVIFFKQPYLIIMHEHHFNALENTYVLIICLICNALICHHTLVSAKLLENHKCKQKKVKQKWLELLLNNEVSNICLYYFTFLLLK